MRDLNERIVIAKHNNDELNQLISDYLPFMKKLIYNIESINIEFEDRLSVAMIVFMNCVRQYEEERGNFISFVATCIKNRLIDENKRESKYSNKIVPLFKNENDDTISTLDTKASLNTYSKELERQNLCDELDAFSDYLKNFGISFDELSKICPKQQRAINQCKNLAKEIVCDSTLKENFLKSFRLPQKELAIKFNISIKTIEKHRKYIVTLALIMLGDYPQIGSFLPQYGEVK